MNMENRGRPLRYSTYLGLILMTHAELLRRLAALLGEEVLLEVLEARDDDEPAPSRPDVKFTKSGAPPIKSPSEQSLATAETLNPTAGNLQKLWVSAGSTSDPYSEIEHAVREAKLPAFLQFHLWAYEGYRRWIETGIELNAAVTAPDQQVLEALAEDAIAGSRSWVESLAFPEPLKTRTLALAQSVWLRFRGDFLAQAGGRRLREIPSTPNE